MRIGLTGKKGFIGFHLSNSLKLHDDIDLIDFDRNFFIDPDKLDNFFYNTDVIVHLAGVNRDNDESKILEINRKLADSLAESAARTNFKGKLIYISSIQEETGSVYGESKLLARKILTEASTNHGFNFTALIVPNVFGPFCKPNYNSFIATFCDNLIKGEEPKIIDDQKIKLIYIDSLVRLIIDEFRKKPNNNINIQSDEELLVSSVLKKLKEFKEIYIETGEIPNLNNQFDIALFNTFRSYINYQKWYPKKYNNNIDSRGNFIEVLRSNSKGQFSYSTTKPGIVRGNHFHTRKIERFAVISGEALIRIRKLGSNKVIEYKFSGEDPSFIDIPVWYTHSIENIGTNDLITLFWINEPYNKEDSDTFFEKV